MAIRRTTINLDQELAREAKEALGATTVTAAIHAALSDAVRRKRLQGLADWQPGDLTLEHLAELRAPRRF